MRSVHPAATHPSMRLPRAVPLEGAFNFRDLGGHPAGKRRVRTRLVYRSDALHLLVGADVARLRRLDIRTVLDLRSSQECARFGVCDAGRFSARYVHIPLVEAPWSPPRPGERAADWLAARYGDLLTESADGIISTLAVVADPASWPVVFHCTGGKDRSGVVAAVLLWLLGVGASDVVADYCRSTPGVTWLRQLRYASLGEDVPSALFEVPAEAMELFLADTARAFGSVEGWARSSGMPPALLSALRANLLT